LATVKPAELKAARKKLGMSQPQLADALGVDRVSVARWETGTRRIPSMLRLALKALQMERRKGER
jgi:DNA-binding transcriptional regulator YiaG